MKVNNFQLYHSLNSNANNLFEFNNKEDINIFIKRLKEVNNNIDSLFYLSDILTFSFMSLNGKVYSLKFSKKEWNNYNNNE